jgi:DNA-binding MarR family transcriptional regulator
MGDGKVNAGKGGAAARAGTASAAAVDPRALDPVLAATLTGLAVNDAVLRRIHAAGFPDLRTSHGFLFQHLVAGPLPIGALARRMGVSQQAASKAAGELERLGYLARSPDPADGRVRRIGLSARGEAALRAGREARAALAAELAAHVGDDRLEAMRGALLDVLDALGGAEAVRGRRVPGVR